MNSLEPTKTFFKTLNLIRAHADDTKHQPCLFQLAVDVLCTCSSSRRSQAAGLQRSASWSAAPWCPPLPYATGTTGGWATNTGVPVTQVTGQNVVIITTDAMGISKWTIAKTNPPLKRKKKTHPHVHFLLKPVGRVTCWPSEAVSQAWCRYHSDRHQSWESAPGSGWQGAGWVSPPCRGRDAAEAETERLGRAGLERAEREKIIILKYAIYIYLLIDFLHDKCGLPPS